MFVCKALLNEAQAKLVNITQDQNQYKSILESLVEQVTNIYLYDIMSVYMMYLMYGIHVGFCNCLVHCSFSCTYKHISAIYLYISCFDNVQGLYQMLEDKVSIRCRQKDEKLLNVITSCIF